jgi:flavodoxin
MTIMKSHLFLTSALLLAMSVPAAGQATSKPAKQADDSLAGRKPKILVAYYSRTGTTRIVADELARRLGADVETITDAKNRRGLFGWLGAGRDASRKSKTAIGPLKYDPSAYDLVLLGTPVWAWNMTPAIRTYILANRERFKKVAFFCTMGKNGDVKTFAGMADLCGQKPLATMALRAEEVKIRQFHSTVNRFLEDIKASAENK